MNLRTIRKHCKIILAFALCITTTDRSLLITTQAAETTLSQNTSNSLETNIVGCWYMQNSISFSFIFSNDGTGISDGGVNFQWHFPEPNTLAINYVNGNSVEFSAKMENDCLVLERIKDGDVITLTYSRNPDYGFFNDTNTDFSEGLAWVQGGDWEHFFWNCFDKSGKGLFQFDATNIKRVTSFSNGYAYLIGEDFVAIIDTAGNVTSKYPIDTYHTVLAYGDGYILTEEFAANFSISGYIIRLCDYNGKILAQSTKPTKGIDNLYDIHFHENAHYCGKGIFAVSYWEDGSAEYFTTEGEVWFQSESKAGDLYYYENTAVMDFDWQTGMLTLINTDGKVMKYNTYQTDLNRFNVPVLSDGVCVFEYDQKNTLGLFNIETQKFFKLNKYTNQLYWDRMPDNLAFTNNCIALPFLGQDGELYVGMFDKEWNVLLEPVLAKSYSGISEGLLIVNDGANTHIYNNKGEEIYTCNIYSDEQRYSSYSDGAFRLTEYSSGNMIYDMDKPTYIDADGNTLFDTIDMSQVSCKNIYDIDVNTYTEFNDSSKIEIQEDESLVAQAQDTFVSVETQTSEQQTPCEEIEGFYNDGSTILTGNYILPQSATQFLSENDLSNLTLKGLCYAKNEIYARYGRRFNSTELTNYFNQQSWYTAKYEASQETDELIISMMNEYEYYNKDVIAALEGRLGSYNLDQ